MEPREAFYLIFGMIAVPVLVLETVGGWRSGSSGPMINGVFASFQRPTQPIRYWLSMGWNGGWALIFSIALVVMIWDLV